MRARTDDVDRSRPGPVTAPEAALAKLLSRTRRTPGPDTLAIVGQIAAQGPAPSPPPPEIPGLTDLVEVGRGGMGVVYRARETRLDRVVAVKVLTAGAALTPDARSRAEREAACLTRVVDPHIVQILYVADVAGAPAIVMEWIDGPWLDEQGAAAIPLAD